MQSTCLGISQEYGQVMVVSPQVTHCDMYVAEQYGGWQEATLQYLGSRFNPDSRTFPSDTMAGVVPAVQQAGAGGGQPDKALKGTVIPFAKLKSDEAIAIGGQVCALYSETLFSGLVALDLLPSGQSVFFFPCPTPPHIIEGQETASLPCGYSAARGRSPHCGDSTACLI